jgi:opacity protein-like surface antigen
MKKTILAATFAILAFAGVSHAADAVGLPGVVVEDYSPKTYVGISASQRVGSNRHNSVGVVVGRQVNPNLTVEGQYEHSFNRKGADVSRDRLSGNVLLGQRFGVVSPYVLGGVGYEWNRNDMNRAVYALGGGAKFHVTEQVDLDARYRYINAFDSSKRGEENVFTLGVNVKF